MADEYTPMTVQDYVEAWESASDRVSELANETTKLKAQLRDVTAERDALKRRETSLLLRLDTYRKANDVLRAALSEGSATVEKR